MKLPDFWRRHRTEAVFLGLFLVLTLVLTALVRVPWIDANVIEPHTRMIAGLSSALLTVLGVPAAADGTMIVSPGFSVEIRKGCDGVEATILLVAACLAYPLLWKRRLLGVVWGYLLIFLTNLLRILVLFILGARGWQSAFEFTHVYIAQFFVIAAAMVFWVFWAGREKALGR